MQWFMPGMTFFHLILANSWYYLRLSSIVLCDVFPITPSSLPHSLWSSPKSPKQLSCLGAAPLHLLYALVPAASKQASKKTNKQTNAVVQERSQGSNTDILLNGWNHNSKEKGIKLTTQALRNLEGPSLGWEEADQIWTERQDAGEQVGLCGLRKVSTVSFCRTWFLSRGRFLSRVCL